MELFENNVFHYENNNLFCENVQVENIIKEYGTPLYIYSKNEIVSRYKELDNAFKNINHRIFYAAKANTNISILKLLNELGSGIDVNSEGEFFRALKAGVSPKDIILTGVGKTKNEIKLGIENEVALIKAESIQEAYLIDSIAKELGKKPNVAFRVNPDVDPQTHPYISTGLSENKFGIDANKAEEIFIEASKLNNININGIDMHIGSQITNIEPFIEAIEKMIPLIINLRNKGIDIQHFDIGGGMGVRYNNESPFKPNDLAKAIEPLFKDLNCKLFLEPGRFITANSGILVAEVLYTKDNKDKNFVIVDASMTDLLRPSIYTSYHHIQPVKLQMERENIVADIVGPVCESGDFLAKKRELQNVLPGEYLAVMSAGAYGMVMSSNYNSRRKPAEVLVDGENFKLIRSRESFEHIIHDELKYINE